MLYSCNISGTEGRRDGGRGSKADDKERGPKVEEQKQPSTTAYLYFWRQTTLKSFYMIHLNYYVNDDTRQSW